MRSRKPDKNPAEDRRGKIPMKVRAIPYPMVSAMSPARIGDTADSPIFPVKRKPTRVPATCGGAASMAAAKMTGLTAQSARLIPTLRSARLSETEAD